MSGFVPKIIGDAFEGVASTLEEWGLMSSDEAVSSEQVSTDAPVCESPVMQAKDHVEVSAPVCLASSPVTGQAPVMTAGQTALFREPARMSVAPPKQEEEPMSPLAIPPHILYAILNHDTLATKKPEEGKAPPPPETVVRITETDGVLKISSEYHDTVKNGMNSVEELRSLLIDIRGAEDTTQVQEKIERAANLLENFNKASLMIRDKLTRYGTSEYVMINNWLDQLHNAKRKEAALAKKTNVEMPSKILTMDGVMLGINMVALNKQDSSMRSGTAVKYLVPEVAAEVAPQFGGQYMGMYRNNVVVSGISAEKVGEFRSAVESGVIGFLKKDQKLPESVGRQLGIERVSTQDLKARDWIVQEPKRMRMTAGHARTEIGIPEIQPVKAEKAVIDMVTRLQVAEERAVESGTSVYTKPIPKSDLKALPILESPPQLKGDPRHLDPLQPRQGSEPITEKELREGKLPNPIREARHSIYHYEVLSALLNEVHSHATSGKKADYQVNIDRMLAFMESPVDEGKISEVSVRDNMSRVYDKSLQHDRMGGVYQANSLPELSKAWGQDRIYVGTIELKNFSDFNKRHTADGKDGYLRRILDINIEGMKVQGVEVIMSVAGGDEFPVMIRGKTVDGRELTAQEVYRIYESVGECHAEVFKNFVSEASIKVPNLPGGRYMESSYVVQGDTLIVEQNFGEMARRELIDIVSEAHNVQVDPKKIKVVEKIADVQEPERMRRATRIDSKGRIIEVYLPKNKPLPPEYLPVMGSHGQTQAPLVVLEPGATAEVKAHAIQKGLQMVDEMKAAGYDRVPTAKEAAALRELGIHVPPEVVKMSWFEKAQQTAKGRTATNFAFFQFGEAVSDMLTGNGGRLLDPMTYAQIAGAYGLLHAGTLAGERAARSAMGLSGEAKVNGWRGKTIGGAGMFGALVALQLGETGEVDPQSLTIALGEMYIARKVTQTGMRLMSAASGTSEMRALKNLSKALKKPTPVSLGISIAMEFTLIKGFQKALYGHEMAKLKSAQREQVSAAMHKLDKIIARGDIVKADGTLDSTVRAEFGQALEEFAEVSGDYQFSLRMDTPEGKKMIEAQSELEKISNESAELNERFPVGRKVHKGRFGQKYPECAETSSVARNRSCTDPDERRHELETKLIPEAKRAYDLAKSQFVEAFKEQLKKAPEVSPTIPPHVHQDPNVSTAKYKESLPTEPVAYYNSLGNYLQSRMILIDQTLMEKMKNVPIPQGPNLAQSDGN